MSQSGKAGLKVLHHVSLTHVLTSCHPSWALAGLWLTFFFIHLKDEARISHCFNRISSVISMTGHFPHGRQPGASLLWMACSYLTFEEFLHLWFVDFVVYEMNPLSHDARQICVRHLLWCISLGERKMLACCRSYPLVVFSTRRCRNCQPPVGVNCADSLAQLS